MEEHIKGFFEAQMPNPDARQRQVLKALESAVQMLSMLLIVRAKHTHSHTLQIRPSE